MGKLSLCSFFLTVICLLFTQLFLPGPVELLDSLPETDAHIIFEMDSWYTCKRLWDKALEKGITLIGAMKTNRILYPDGHRPICYIGSRHHDRVRQS